MTTKRRLTLEEWSAARHRWQGDPRDGFNWLAAELRASLSVEITRQAVGDMARRKAWAKESPPSTSRPPAAVQMLAALAQVRAELAQEAKAKQKAQQPGGHGKQRGGYTLPKAEPTGLAPVGLPPGEKPPGYQGTGRPSLYRTAYARQVIDFFSIEAYTTIVQDRGEDRDPVVVQAPSKFPTLERFAAGIGVSAKRLKEWADALSADGSARHPEFRDAYARARDLQRAVLIEGAMVGAYEARVASLALKNLADWRDKVDVAAEVVPTSAADLQSTYVSRMNAAYARQAEVMAERGHLWAND